MKPTILKISVFFLLFSLMGAGCEKDDSYEEISLEYSKCPCDHETNFVREITVDDVLLFDASKTSLSEIQELTLSGKEAKYVSYYPEKDSALYCHFKNIDVAYNNSIGYFCNFPKSAELLTIPYEGIPISFSADEFEACSDYPAIAFDRYTENVLTSLKIKTK